MKAYLVCIATAALWISPAQGQNIMEHAAAAAGATIGTGAGKALSNGIDKVLGKAAETGSNAAKTPVRKAPPTAPPTNPPSLAPAPSQTPLTPGAPSQRARSRRSVASSADRDKPVFAAPEVPESAPAAPVAVAPLPLTPEDFAKVKEGASRADVLVALGVASSHVTIPDDGHLIEILSYSDANNRRVGSVRIDNGVVVTVSAAQ
jgi:hypothetical protein